MATADAVGAVTPAVHYVGDGAETEFPFSFTVFQPRDLAVFLDGAPVASGYGVAIDDSDGGGTVIFELAPDNGTRITLRRGLKLGAPVEFQQGGPVRANALNHGFNYLTAACRDLQARVASALHYPLGEPPPNATLPSQDARKGQLLKFDSAGAPGLLDPAELDPDTDTTINDSGDLDYLAHSQASPRSVEARLRERLSVRDFGAVGDGTTDDTTAFRTALAESDAVFVPPGTYRLTGTLDLGQGQRLAGQGDTSRLVADSNSYPLLAVRESYCQITALRLEGGDPAIRLRGDDGPCVATFLSDLTIWDATVGLLLDGGDSFDRPCYWNFAGRVLVVRPGEVGVRLMKSGSGDTPNANRFQQLRVYSLDAATNRAGIAVDGGQSLNTFTDCEINVDPGVTACFIVGSNSTETVLVNLYCETTDQADNVLLESGSQATRLVNLGAYSAGEAINDKSGGEYEALNAGWPRRNTLGQSYISALTADKTTLAQVIFDTAFDEQDTTYNVATATRYHLVSSYNGARDAVLPKASEANGEVVTIKKSDVSSNAVTVKETDGPGPDNDTVTLGSQYDAVTCFSNGANWWIVARHP